MPQYRAIIDVLPHQLEFATSKNKFVALVGGYGSGKSFGVPLRCLELLKFRRGLGRILVLSESHRMNQDNLLPLFFEIFSGYNIPYDYHKSDKIMSINLPSTKGQILFRSCDNARMIKGLTVSDFIIDEFDSIPYNAQIAVWRESIARIRKVPRGTGAITTTPEGFKYTYELFEKGINDKPPIGYMIKAKTYDNPFVDDEYIENMENQFDKKVQRQYLHAEFVDINSLPAYYGFNQKNIWERHKVVGDYLHIGMDFNVDPMVAVVGEIGMDGKLFIFEEIIIRNANTQIMASEIKKRYPKAVITVYPDLTGIKRTTNAPLGYTDIKILKGSPYNFRVQGTQISTQRDRLNTVNGAFDHKKVIITEKCKELINDLRAVNRNADGGIDKKREIAGKPFVHITDAASYMIERIFPLVKRSGVTIVSR